MAVCTLCESEMFGSISCAKTPVVTELGEFTPVPFGAELRMRWPRGRPCDDCGVARGGFHHRGCDLEECPCCRRRLLSCGCGDDPDELDDFDDEDDEDNEDNEDDEDDEEDDR